MRKVMKRIKGNLYRRYYEPTSDDYAMWIVAALVVGLVIRWIIG